MLVLLLGALLRLTDSVYATDSVDTLDSIDSTASSRGADSVVVTASAYVAGSVHGADAVHAVVSAHGTDPVFSTDSVYASAALRDLVARAALGNREMPAELSGYAARVESEVALVLFTAEGEELTGQIEQIASRLEWRRNGMFEQRVVGHRVRAASPNVSALTYLQRGWLVPSLYGEWLRVAAAQDSTRSGERRGSAYEAIHPFSSRRESVYRFEGGDTVAVLRLPDRTLRVVRVRVTPRRAPDGPALLFHGDVDLDADRHQIIRIRGRLLAHRPGRGLAARIASLGLTAVAYLELENGEHDGRYWLPYRQRLEFQAMNPLTDSRAIIRIVSHFRDYGIERQAAAASAGRAAGRDSTLAADPAPALATLPADSTRRGRPAPRLTFAPGDSLARYDEWVREPGAATAHLSSRDFDDVAPPALRPTGPPHVRFGVRRFSELVRYNRVEGLYTGAGAVLAFRDAAPGLEVRGSGGWAWSESTARGAIEASFTRAPWTFAVRAGRELAHTNDFTPPFERNPGVLLLFGGPDDHDYVDRRGTGVTVAREFSPGGESQVRLDVGWYDDRPERRRLRHAPGSRDTLRLNRPITPGRYVASRLTLERGRSINANSLRPGLGTALVLERADGDLIWHRIETGLQLRAMRGPFTLAGRIDAGLVVGEPAPLQTLYELGGGSTLPGYDPKEFGGDRAVLLRGTVRYGPGILDAPIRIGGLVLPALAPAPAVRWQAGWAAAPGDAAASIERLGSRETGGLRSTLDLQLTFFGGMIGVGVARPLDRHARWKMAASIGGGV